MKSKKLITLFLGFLLLCSCVTRFIPEIDEDQEMLVVEGLITDQPVANTIKLSKSMPLGKRNNAVPLQGCNVFINDDIGNSYSLTEIKSGVYATDSTKFKGVVGRKYVLKVFTNDVSFKRCSFESFQMEMKPVPPIDSIYYEKRTFENEEGYVTLHEGCQIYLATHDPEDNCSYYRYDYTETWEFHIPYDITNKVCWITNNSSDINIKNAALLSENRITRLPVKLITGETDRLSQKYSILVNQYSLNEDEFIYWEKMQKITEAVGSLYDITPASVPNNLYCIDDPNEKVLGYFSVSAKSSKRIFIEDNFSGLVNLYTYCAVDTIFGNSTIPNLGINCWVIEDASLVRPRYKVITDKKGCADCTVRGTTTKPYYWDDDK